MYTLLSTHIHNKCHLALIFLMVCSGKKKKGGSSSVDSDGGDGVSPGSSAFVVLPDAVQEVAECLLEFTKLTCFSEFTVCNCFEGVLPPSLF